MCSNGWKMNEAIASAGRYVGEAAGASAYATGAGEVAAVSISAITDEHGLNNSRTQTIEG